MSEIIYPTNGRPEFPNLNLTPKALRGLKATLQLAKATLLEQEEQIKALTIKNHNLNAVVERVVSGDWTVDDLRRAWEDGKIEEEEKNK